MLCCAYEHRGPERPLERAEEAGANPEQGYPLPALRDDRVCEGMCAAAGARGAAGMKSTHLTKRHKTSEARLPTMQ